MDFKDESSKLEGAAHGAEYLDGYRDHLVSLNGLYQLRKGAFKLVRSADYTSKAMDYTKRPIKRKKKYIARSLNPPKKRALSQRKKIATDKNNNDASIPVPKTILDYEESKEKERIYTDTLDTIHSGKRKGKSTKKEYPGFSYLSGIQTVDYTTGHSSNDQDYFSGIKDKDFSALKVSANKKWNRKLGKDGYSYKGYVQRGKQKEKGSKKTRHEKVEGKTEEAATKINEPFSYTESHDAGYQYADTDCDDRESGIQNRGEKNGKRSIHALIGVATGKAVHTDSQNTSIFAKSKKAARTVRQPLSSTLEHFTSEDDSAASQLIKSPVKAVETVKTLMTITKILFSVINFVSSLVSIILPILLVLVLLVSIIFSVTSFFSSISLKSTDEELSKTYAYVTELDTDFTIDVLNEKKGANDYTFYMNGSICSEDDLRVQTNIVSLMAYFDTKYQDYALDKVIYGLFGGVNVKEEIKHIHAQLYSYETTISYRNVMVGKDSTGNDIYESRQHKSIVVTTEYFDTWLLKNKPDLFKSSEYEQYELIQSIGVFRTKKELASPFPEHVLQVSSRYGYYNENTKKLRTNQIEVQAKKGDDVYAAYAGEVTESVNGDYLHLVSGNKIVSYTNITNCAPVGAKIKKGEKIGIVGNKINHAGTYVGIAYTKDNKEMCPFIFLTGCDNDYFESNGNTDIIQVALSQLGQNGGRPYWSWYGFGGRVDWCACFVSWCADQCGFIDNNVIVKHASCTSGVKVWRSRNQFQMRSSGYIPKAGDIIYFDWGQGNPPDHVGFVQSCDGTTVYTVEGNSGDAVRQQSYSVNDTCIYGYATPIYPSMSDPGKNAKTIWNFFKSKGCNAHAVSGILGNLYQESTLDPGKYQNTGPGRGLAQWEYGEDRYDNLVSFAAKRGTDWQNLTTQLEFIWFELNGGDPTTKSILDRSYGGINGFKQAKSTSWAVEAFERSFERAGIPNLAKRIEYANNFYQLFTSK